jgi:hypothetical protein
MIQEFTFLPKWYPGHSSKVFLARKWAFIPPQIQTCQGEPQALRILTAMQLATPRFQRALS